LSINKLIITNLVLYNKVPECKKPVQIPFPPLYRGCIYRQQWRKIADSDPSSSNTFESFDRLISFKNAIIGETGTAIESLTDDNSSTKAITSYKPIDAFHNT
jgi:hypothetical protein